MTATVVGPVVAPLRLPGGIFAAYNITAAAVLATGPAVACTLACQLGGSITLNDNASSSSGNSISNQFFTGTLTAGQRVALNVPCASGVTASAVSSGTFSLTFS